MRRRGGVVFVNPTQFGPSEDFEHYPRDLTKDTALLTDYNVDYIFAPPPEEIYPKDFSTYVNVGGLSKLLEGETRPGPLSRRRYRGCDSAQYRAPRLCFLWTEGCAAGGDHQTHGSGPAFDTEIVVLPTVREDSGLAISSRNLYLDLKNRSRPR